MSSIETSILNKIRDLARMPELVDRLAAEHRLSADVVYGMNVALDEMLSNIIKYGFADDGIHEIHVRLSASPLSVLPAWSGNPLRPAASRAFPRSGSAWVRNIRESQRPGGQIGSQENTSCERSSA
jgi:two-component sensor histidine kinase